MGNPAQAATQDELAEDNVEEVDAQAKIEENTEEDNDAEPTFENKVNAAVDSMKQDVKGNWVLPENLSDEVKYAATLEKRRRDTQSDYTRTKQEKKRLEAEKAALLKKAKGNLRLQLTKEQVDELEDLKFSDPEAWRKKVNNYEREAYNRHDDELDKELKQVSTSALDDEELEDRKQVLAKFNQDHADFQLNDDIIANDIPPRIVKRLETGEISFEAFLQEAYEFTRTGKVIKQDKVRKQPNLSKVGGGSAPDKNAKREDAIRSYDKEVY